MPFSDAVADLAAAPDDDTLKNLDSLLIALGHVDVNLDGVPGSKLRHVVAQIGALHFHQLVHDSLIPQRARGGRLNP